MFDPVVARELTIEDVVIEEVDEMVEKMLTSESAEEMLAIAEEVETWNVMAQSVFALKLYEARGW